MERLFVYGTLMGRVDVMSVAATLIDDRAQLLGFTLYTGGAFPMAVRQFDASVDGEVWAIADGDWRRLDAMEGVSSGLYTREAMVVVYDEPAPSPAFVYTWPHDTARLTHIGPSWAAYRQEHGYA